jgi:ADP-ribosylglycohydrolase
MTTRDKVLGMLLGVGVGDALGRPAEGWAHEEVRSTYGRIENYIVPEGWPADRRAGVTTDDTLLSIAVAEGLLASGGKPDIKAQVQAHVNAFSNSTQGWGPTTYGAVRRLAQGVAWQLAGARSGRITGEGTGAIMKLGATALLLVQRVPGAVKFIADLVSMTHQTSVAVSAGLAHVSGLSYCLEVEPPKFDAAEFVRVVVEASKRGRRYFPDTLTEENITERFGLCHDFAEWPPERCVAQMQNGRNHVYHSLPFTYMFFLRQPKSVEALYDVVSAGGDTDTNGSVAGSLLGALNSTAVFPTHLIEELEGADRLVTTANRLCDLFGIE